MGTDFDLDRERTLHACVYFLRQTSSQACDKIKLFHLFYLLDFDHFRETGASVTCMEYAAWKSGPVPLALAQELNSMSPRFSDVLSIETSVSAQRVQQVLRVKAGTSLNSDLFTRRQFRLMVSIAEQQANSEARDVCAVHNAAYSRIWDGGRGAFARIPYELAAGNAAIEPARSLDRSRAGPLSRAVTAVAFWLR